jgi:hypothetical protein
LPDKTHLPYPKKDDILLVKAWKSSPLARSIARSRKIPAGSLWQLTSKLHKL